jgi:hypothetical protein
MADKIAVTTGMLWRALKVLRARPRTAKTAHQISLIQRKLVDTSSIRHVSDEQYKECEDRAAFADFMDWRWKDGEEL